MILRVVLICVLQMLVAMFTHQYGIKNKSFFWEFVGFSQMALCAGIILFLLTNKDTVGLWIP